MATRLRENPDGVLETLAREHGVTLLDATRMLSSANVRWTDAGNFQAIMAELATWGDVLFLVHTPSIVLEVKGAIPAGAPGKGYFNLHGNSPIAGHLKADRCVDIAFVRRPFMALDSASIQFFDSDGGAMFKVFVRRNADKTLDGMQLARFEDLAKRFANPTSNAA
ncbi:MAG: heme utilization cystosolic carrier protein HutX [Hyphomicrobiales bacterium]|nr:heme utilization cystosolic carrier protein HutX [Hyphomicrobiales bacterium]